MIAAKEQERSDSQRLSSEHVRSLRLVLSSRVAIESKTDSAFVIFHFDTNARLKLSAPLYDLICKFKTPASVAEVLSPYTQQDSLIKLISQLMEKGILVDEEHDLQPAREMKLTAKAQTIFNCPHHNKSEASQVSVVGVPFDLGNTVAPGARLGPHEIRRCSYQYDYRLDFLSGRPVGWFDLDFEERILEGVTFSDWGDVWFEHGEHIEKIFERVNGVCEDIVRAGSFPLFLGGDHSISFPLVEALQREQPMSIIWLDAHNDLGQMVSGGSHNHANVARRILDLPNVKRIVQVGLRGYTIYNELELGGERVKTVTASKLRASGSEAVLKLLPESDAFYISLDIDVLDPIYAPGTSTPVPGGLSPDALKDLLHTIGLHRKVVGLDLVEVNPDKDHDNMTSRVACQLLLAAMGAIMQR